MVVGLSGDESNTRCSGGPRSGREVGRLGVSSVPFTGRAFSILLCLPLLAVKQSLLLGQFLFHISEYLEELGFISRWQVDVSGCPLRRRGDGIFCDKIEPLKGIMSPAVVVNLSLEVVLRRWSAVFWGHTCWRGFLRRDLIREKSEHFDSDLNESTNNVGVNSQKEFIYTSNCSWS